MTETSMLETVKIQAAVLIPVVKELEREFGKERAHAVVGRAIAGWQADCMANRTHLRDMHPGEFDDGLDYPVESEIVEHSDTSYGFNITHCAFADFFRDIGEPEIGALLTCNADFAVEHRLRPSWEFERTQTRMEGAEICDFRWRRKAPG